MNKISQNLDFAQNFNALGSPQGLKNFIIGKVDSIFRYPQIQSFEAAVSIARLIQCDKNSIAVTNGSTETFFNLPKFLKDKKALIVQPTFWEYEFFNKKENINIDSFPLREEEGFNLKVGDLEKNIQNDEVIYLCNPNNPTSTIIPKNKLINMILRHEKSTFVIDETYLLFRHDYFRRSLVKHVEKLRNLYIVSSMSKVFSIPGVRAGFIVSAHENILSYSNWQVPYSSPALSEDIIKWISDKNSFLEKTQRYYMQARRVFFKQLQKSLKNKIDPIKPEANFILAKILTNQTSTEVAERLKAKGLLIRDCIRFVGLGNKWIRFAIKTEKENKLLIKNLDEILIL